MKIGVVCCTYLRPKELGHLIFCFEQQEYPDREMVILDDAGQYHSQGGPRWQLVSQANRYPSLGAKRNAAAALLSPDVEAMAMWDDDDWYLPWALSATAVALKAAAWSRPSVVLRYHRADETFRQYTTWAKADQSDKAYQGGWGYRRELFESVGGYPDDISNGEDVILAQRYLAANASESDPIALGWPAFYVYGPTSIPHLSNLGPGNVGYQRLATTTSQRCKLIVAPPPHCELRRARIVSHVAHRPFRQAWTC